MVFVNVSGTDLDLQEIKPMNGSSAVGDGEMTIRWYDNGKYSYAMWCDPAADPLTGEDLPYAAWGDRDSYEKIEKTFLPGEGFLLDPGVADPRLTFPNPFYVAPAM